MNPVKRIGRYSLPLGSVLVVEARDKSGWRRIAFWIRGGYDAILSNGRTIHFTEAEKTAYDQALEEHAVIMQVWGMCKSAGLRA